MSSNTRQRLFSAFVLLCVLFNLTSLPVQAVPGQEPPAQTDPARKIEPELLEALKAGQSADFFIHLTTQADLRPARNLKTRAEKGAYVFKALRDTASRSQKGLLASLDARQVRYQPYFISNTVLVYGGSASLALALVGRPDVSRISPNRTFRLPQPIRAPALAGPRLSGIEDNLKFIQADQVWAMNITGAGIVVAGNDTGIEWNHPAIKSHYRGWNGTSADHNYNWWDATHTYPTAPADGDGHGTHTTGTMVGDDGQGKQIGVAPGAKTIHCKMLDDTGSGDDAMARECFEWNLAPWKLDGSAPDPSRAPDVVNNSWGFTYGGVDIYREEIAALQAAGIMMVFSAGNNGPECNTLSSLGDYDEVLTIGSVDHYSSAYPGRLSEFSSRGPSSLDNGALPDVVAPGEGIVSSIPGGDYTWSSGTSMAGPHAVGLVALLWQANPSLRGDIANTTWIIKNASTPLTGQLGSNCGGDYELGPNNDWGSGTIHAKAAVDLALAFNTLPRLQGTITGPQGEPLAGAQVDLYGPARKRAYSDANGVYTFRVMAGAYDINVLKAGYLPAKASQVLAQASQTTIQDFQLAEARKFTLSGTVYDDHPQTGWPVYARISVSGDPFTPPAPHNVTFSSPVTGQYAIQLQEGVTYQLEVQALVPGYPAQTFELGPLSADKLLAIGLRPDPFYCNAPGYQLENYTLETFDQPSLPDGWTVMDHSDSGAVWQFDDPGQRGNQTGGSGGFAIADSDNAGMLWMDTSLISPNFALPAGGRLPDLSFDTEYQAYALTQELAEVDVSIDNGLTWVNALQWGYPGMPTTRAGLDLNTLLGPGQPQNLRVRFHYAADWAWYWQVDNVRLSSCSPLAGGLLTGFVRDANNQAAVNGARVYPLDQPAYQTTSFATPEDNAQPDGLYILFSPQLGLHTYQAEGFNGYGSDQQVVDITNRQVSQASFTLAAGQLTALPGSLNVTLKSGQQASRSINLSNNGQRTAAYDLWEIGAGPSTIPQAPSQGTVLREPEAAFPGPSALAGRRPDTQPSGATFKQPAPVQTTSAQASPASRPIAQDAPWRYVQDYPVPISGPAAVLLDGKVYSFGGYDQYLTLKTSYVYDPASDQWSEIAPMQVAREKAAAAASGGKVYITGGWPELSPYIPDPTLEIYDPTTNTWSTGTPIPAAYAASAAVALDGYIYWIGGRALSASVAEVYRYDPAAGTWASMAPYPVPVSWHACGALLGRIYCAGGIGPNDGELTSTYMYDPLRNEWIARASLPAPVWGTAYSTPDNQLFLNSGVLDDWVTSESFVYDPVSDSWSSGPAANFAVYRAGSACGFYKIGGGFFEILPYVEHHPGLDQCAYAEIPWLAVTPAQGQLEPAAQQSLQVTFDAATEVASQPGVYQARLLVQSDTPYPPHLVDMRMVVEPLETWGKLSGLVVGSDACGQQAGAPFTGAQLEIWSGDTLVKTIQPDAGGAYQWWLEAGEYTLVAGAAGYVSHSQTVTLQAGQTITSDFTIRPDAPCPIFDPIDILVSIPKNGSTTETLHLSNAGLGLLRYEISVDVPWLSAPAGITTLDPGASIDIPVQINAAGLPAGEYDGKLIFAIEGYGSLLLHVSVWLTVNADFTLTAEPEAQLTMPGQTAEYTLTVRNQTSADLTFDIALSGGAWPSAPSVTQIGPLAPNQAQSFTVQVSVPASAAPGLQDTVKVNVTRHNFPDQSAAVDLTTTALRLVKLQASPVHSEKEGTSASAVAHKIDVTNQGNSADQFMVTVQAGAWKPELTTQYLVIAAGKSMPLTANVRIPPGALDSASDQTFLTIRSMADPDVSQVVTLTTTSRNHYQLGALFNPGQVDIFTGSTRAFPLVITNLGNSTDTVSLSISAVDWPAQLDPVQLTGLAPGEQRTVMLWVTIPAGTPAGASQAITVEAVSENNPAQKTSATLALTVRHAVFLPALLR